MLTQEQINELQTHPISWSRLKHYDRSPAHFIENWLNPPEPTPAMTLGSALHCLVLEPDKFEARYIVAPEGIDRRTKSGKEMWTMFEAGAKGKTILTAEQFRQANGMSGAILDCNAARKLLEQCPRREDTITWTDAMTSLPCKGVVDAWGEGGFALDIKTTPDASERAFPRTVANYMYHGQAAFYMEGLRLNGLEMRNFFFVAVETNPPHGVQVFMCSADTMIAGRGLYMRLLEQHAECCAAGLWTGYPDSVTALELPAWAA